MRTKKMLNGHNGIGLSKFCLLGSENMKSTFFFRSDKRYEANNVQIAILKLYYVLN
jgi:hypothetical protein